MMRITACTLKHRQLRSRSTLSTNRPIRLGHYVSFLQQSMTQQSRPADLSSTQASRFLQRETMLSRQLF
jgi:hypothetical protein